MGIYSKQDVILIDNSKMNETLFSTLAYFREALDGKDKQLLRRTDYLRWSYVFDLLPKKTSILDVGVGAGQFVHALATSDHKFTSIRGLDVAKHTKFFTDSKGIDMMYASVGDIPLDDNSVDIVTCMEVLEHLDDELMLQGIEELRRVANKRMIVTVPYCEKEPLPKFHKQRYNLTRIKELFPTAEITFFSLNNSMAWVLIDEQL